MLSNYVTFQLKTVAFVLAALLLAAIAILATVSAQTGPKTARPAALQPRIVVPSLTKRAKPGGKAVSKTGPPAGTSPAASKAEQSLTMAVFLDRLMLAESNGSNLLANPRSSALGPFQFIRATFLSVARRHFAAEVATLSEAQILALRTNRTFARKAAKAYCEDNAAFLAARGATPSFTNLRLAFLLGPGGAIRVLRAPETAPLSTLLSPGALRANPNMVRMNAGDLIAKAARDLLISPKNRTRLKLKPGQKPGPAKPAKPAINVQCNLRLPSCRRWLALQQRKLNRLSLKKSPQRKP